MRDLVVLRGSPACGKSTFLKNSNLYQYVLCADEIRLLYQSPILQMNGTLGISQNNDKVVWETLFIRLEERMSRGEFIIVDATHSKASDFKEYKKLANTYKYKIWCVDFTGVSKSITLIRNKRREEYKRVPVEVIDKMYERFATEKVPEYVTVIKPQEFNEIFKFKPKDFSSWKKIHHIGDLHSCYTVLADYLNNELTNDELYIFCGDYLDRGIEHINMLTFLMTIADFPNVILLEGNHEKHLWAWANSLPVNSEEFNSNTRIALETENVDKKSVKQFCQKLKQMVYYTYDNKHVIVTHGGISNIPDNFNYISADQVIRGVGKYKEDVDSAFMSNTSQKFCQIHGHRNTQCFPIQAYDRCYNLEGNVEFHGNLRVVTLDKQGFECHTIKNQICKTDSKYD